MNNLERRNTTILWEAPFSLNLTNVEPDIVYCVEVYNITCGRRKLLISDCDVTETSYTSDVIAPVGYIYEYIVSPKSNVEGAINGTPSQPVRGIEYNSYNDTAIINPLRMRSRVTVVCLSVCLSVCLCVCYRSNCSSVDPCCPSVVIQNRHDTSNVFDSSILLKVLCSKVMASFTSSIGTAIYKVLFVVY